ncbi:MAG: hypothetical protein J2P28_26485, partial [Actinobacteria bacterium]|nr:hypothetical protein [Actinomycetota bacterium]
SILAGIAILVGILALIIPGLILVTIWAVIVPVIVLEGATWSRSFGRSQDLVRGHGWQVFGTLVMVFLIMVVVNILLSVVIFAWLPIFARNLLGTVISGTLIAPFLALVVTLIYYRLSRPGAEAQA